MVEGRGHRVSLGRIFMNAFPIIPSIMVFLKTSVRINLRNESALGCEGSNGFW